MKRTTVLALGALTAALLVVAGAALAGLGTPFGGGQASAQTVPTPPMIVFGDIPGAAVGQKVYAIITVGGVSTTCGQGLVIDSGGPKYVLTVVSDNQTPGCGATGRTVAILAGPANPGVGPQLASQTTTWESGKGKGLNLTLGAALTVRARTALVTRAP